MESKLVVKNVQFCQAELLAVQEKESGKIYTGINCILRELGFDERQIEYRREKWTTDKAVSKGTRKFSGTLMKAGTGREIWCIDVMRLPLALAKLEVTPKMQEQMPDLAEKLERYQDECADVLAAAFLPQKKPQKRIAQSSKEAVRMYMGKKTPIVTVGSDVYEVDHVDYQTLAVILLRLHDMDIKRIPDIARVFLKVCSNRPECLIDMTDSTAHVKTECGEVLHVEAGRKIFIADSVGEKV